MKPVLKNLLLLNVVIIALWWAMTEGSPWMLYTTVDSPKGASIDSVGGRKINLAGGGVQTYRIILPSDFKGTDIPLHIEPNDANVRLVSARVVRRFVFESVWDVGCPAAEISHLQVADATNRVPLKVLGLLGVLEIFLCVLSWLIALLTRRARVPSRSECACASVAVALVFVLVAPLQVAVANAAEINAGVLETLGALVAPFFATAIALWGLLILTRRSAGPLFAALFLGVALYAYLELGLLSVDFPVLDGEIYFFMNGIRGVVDAAVLFATCALVVFFSTRRSEVLPIVSLSVVLLSSASVFDSRKSVPQAPRSELGLSFKPNGEILADCYHSSKRNVAVYVLDSVAIPFATEVLCRDPQLAEALDGFIAYTNNIGMAYYTVLGVAGLTTGEYLSDPLRITDYAQSCFGSNSFLRAYLDRGSSVFYAPGSFKYGLSSVTGGGLVAESGTPLAPLRRRMKDQQQWNLFELSRFRLIPFIAKVFVYRMTISGWDVSRTEYDERWCFPKIANAPIRFEGPQTLQLWHTLGAHPPYDVNREGIMDGIVREGDSGAFEKTWFALRQFAGHLKHLKERGVYDQTFIVLTSDHGTDGRHVKSDDVPWRARAILFVKPIGSRGRLACSSEPTSHSKIKELMETVAIRDLDFASCTSLLKTTLRVYSVEENGRMIDYRIDKNGNLIEKVPHASMAVSELPVIDLGCEYSLFSDNIRNPPPIRFEGTAYWGATDPRVIQNPPKGKMATASMSFRVPSANRRYRIQMEIRTSGMAHSVGPDGYSFLMEDVKSGTKGGLRECTPALREVELRVQADERAIVSVIFSCHDTVELRRITVRAE